MGATNVSIIMRATNHETLLNHKCNVIQSRAPDPMLRRVWWVKVYLVIIMRVYSPDLDMSTLLGRLQLVIYQTLLTVVFLRI